MYKEKETNSSRKTGLSSVTLKHWVGLNDTSSLFEEMTTKHFGSSDTESVPVKKKSEDTDYFAETDKASFAKDFNYSYAHCLHQSIEALAHSLNEKIDVLQNTQVDIHHIEIITDRVFHNIEKLRNELRSSNSYVQSLENKNKSLESKLDVLLLQNELIMQKYTKLELVCERFFSKNSDLENLENKMLVLESKFSNPTFNGYDTLESSMVEKARELTEEELYSDEIYSDEIYDKKSTRPLKINEREESLDELYPQQIQETEEVDEDSFDKNEINSLNQSKKQVEEFMKNNYPKDYKRFTSYNRKSVTGWLNKLLRLN